MIMWKIKILCVFSMILTAISGIAALPVEPGVSLDLARQRKANISDIVYNLSLNIDSLT